MALSYEDFFVHLPLVAVDSTLQRVGFCMLSQPKPQNIVPKALGTTREPTGDSCPTG